MADGGVAKDSVQFIQFGETAGRNIVGWEWNIAPVLLRSRVNPSIRQHAAVETEKIP